MQAVSVREASEADVPAIRQLFEQVYGHAYPYQGFFDETWLKRSVYSDDLVMLVAENEAGGEVIGTASVALDTGAHSDLIGEFGRLVVDPRFTNRGVGRSLMQERVEYVKNRLHAAIVENRTVHPYSQRVSAAFGFAPVGLLPLKLQFAERESVALFACHFGDGLVLRRNHPRLVPEAHLLSSLALDNCGLGCDAVVDDTSPSYGCEHEFALEQLTAEGLPALLRIERGRLHNRQVFGPMRLHYGFFKLAARRASYLVARRRGHGAGAPVAGAIGYIHDRIERSVRVFELIGATDEATRFLWEALIQACELDWKVAYLEADISAFAPRMQRTLVELGFVPAAYVPAMVFHDVERLDVVKMVRLFVHPVFSGLELSPAALAIAQPVIEALSRQSVLPQIASAVHRLDLFEGLDEEQARRVASVCSVAEFEPGQTLFERGEMHDRLHILIDGSVKVRRGEPLCTIGEVKAGECLGELSLVTQRPHSADAMAVKAVTAAVLRREKLESLGRQRPDIALVLYRNLAAALARKLDRLGASVAQPGRC